MSFRELFIQLQAWRLAEWDKVAFQTSTIRNSVILKGKKMDARDLHPFRADGSADDSRLTLKDPGSFDALRYMVGS